MKTSGYSILNAIMYDCDKKCGVIPRRMLVTPSFIEINMVLFLGFKKIGLYVAIHIKLELPARKKTVEFSNVKSHLL